MELGESPRTMVANGAALAAFLAAGIGSLALGFFVILNEAGLFSAPALYERAGGLSGRTTFAVVIWLIAWVLLHRRWRNRHVEPRRVQALTLALIGLALLSFPPLWELV